MKPQMKVFGTHSSYLVCGPKPHTDTRERSMTDRPNRTVIDPVSPASDVRKRCLFSLLILTPSLSRPLLASALPGFKKDLTPRRKKQDIPIEEYSELQNGLLYYDVKVGSGPAAVEGDRVAIHFDCKWKGVTFVTSRQGNGVTGGVPFGFDVGISETPFAKNVIKGMDQGVQGMRVGGVIYSESSKYRPSLPTATEEFRRFRQMLS